MTIKNAKENNVRIFRVSVDIFNSLFEITE